MKKYFQGKSFGDELDVWAYLQELKDLDLGVAEDGHYFGEFLENSMCQLNFRCILKFETRESLKRILYFRPKQNARFYVHVKSGKSFCIGIDSVHLKAHEEINDSGEWQLMGYRDFVLEEGEPKEEREFTAKEKAMAAEALMKLLIVSPKKVV